MQGFCKGQSSMKKLVLPVVLIVVCGAVYAFWGAGASKAAKQSWRTAALEKGDVTQVVSANGTLNPVVLVSVGTQVSGTVKKLHADFNDKVSEGQVLAELDPALFEAQVSQSEAGVRNVQAQLDLARANAARANDLLAKKYISRQEFDQSQQALKSAEAQLALAEAQLRKDRTNLHYSVIRSPVSGVVVDRQVNMGQTVAANFQTPTLFRIAQDLKDMQIDTSFAEADIGNIRLGQPVQFTVDAFPGRVFPGTVLQIRLSPTTQQNVVTYDVVASVKNPDETLLPGMTAYVNIVVAERKDVLLVPNAALRFRPREAQVDTLHRRKNGKGAASATVYVLDQGVPKAVPVQVGITDSRMTEVTGGDLHTGDAVITEDLRSNGNAVAQDPGMRMRVF